MAAKKQNSFMSWLSANAINLIILVGGMLIAWGALNTRVNAIEAKVAEYPSQDWFELKFDEIDKSLESLERQVDENTLVIRSGSKVIVQPNP